MVQNALIVALRLTGCLLSVSWSSSQFVTFNQDTALTQLHRARRTQPAARELWLQSDAIRACQVGYRVNESKHAALHGVAGDSMITLRRVSDQTVAITLRAAPTRVDDDSGDELREIDFSELREPGTYYIDVSGVGVSHPFRIGDDVFNRTFELAMRSFYGQRCGTRVDLSPDFPQYEYEACHLEPAHFDGSSGKAGTIECTGGWHDAGDFGRYVVNSGITTGTLLWAFELNQDKLARLDLHIPESGRKLPDMLAEIKWNLDWMLKMQDVDGGVWHKATTASFPAFIMPAQDKAPTLIIGSGESPFKTTQATGDLAAVCAIAARLYRPFDEAYADRCLDASRRAWSWLESTPDHPYIKNPAGISTGGYGDRDARDERLWAAAELFRTTGDDAYHQYFLDHYAQWSPTIRPTSPQGWGNVENMAMYTYVLSGRTDLDPEARRTIARDSLAAADEITTRVRNHAYHIALLPSQYGWGSNSVVANYAMMLQIANRISPRQSYVDAAADALHYLCGRNTFNTSFITHVGSKWAVNPHHRPSGADGVEQPWPGLLVGGPNVNQGRKELNDDSLPPARCWVDRAESYTMNENAINWNAALVFVLADVVK